MPDPTPLVRVREARLVAEGGPGRFVVSRLEQPAALAAALTEGGARAGVTHGRLEALATPGRIVEAAAATVGRERAAALEQGLADASVAWSAPPPDLATPAGALACSRGPVVMGIVNATPDSFSDGGDYFDPDDPAPAIAHARRLVDAGAQVIDVGGESTRPGAEPVPADRERERVLPVVEALAGDGAVVSVDTSKADVAREAVGAGAALVNDVTAGRGDERMAPTVAELGVPYVVMHMLGTPRTMQDDPRYDDVVAEVFEFLAARLAHLRAAGVRPGRLVVDPGIGFGKTLAHNLALLGRLRELTSLGRPVLAGASRKSFLGAVAGTEEPGGRVAESLAAACAAAARGAGILRVHDVAQTVRALAVTAALDGAAAAPQEG